MSDPRYWVGYALWAAGDSLLVAGAGAAGAVLIIVGAALSLGAVAPGVWRLAQAYAAVYSTFRTLRDA